MGPQGCMGIPQQLICDLPAGQTNDDMCCWPGQARNSMLGRIGNPEVISQELCRWLAARTTLAQHT